MIKSRDSRNSKTASVSLGSNVLCWGSLQSISQFLNRVNRPSKTGDTINNVHYVFFANIIGTFAACLVQEETLQMGFSHESVHKQEVFARKKTCYIGGKSTEALNGHAFMHFISSVFL